MRHAEPPSMHSPALVALLVAVALAFANFHASAQILSVSSFRECLSITDSNGTSLDCGTSSFATVVEIAIDTGQEGDNTERFQAQISVVPNQGSDETQTGTGTDCPAPDDTTCQTVTAATIAVSAGAATHGYLLTEVVSASQSGVPYEHYFNPSARVIDTDDESATTVPSLATLVDTVPTVQCTYVSTMITGGATPIALDSEFGTMQATFDNADSNFDHIGCGTRAHAPQNLRATRASGSVTYTHACQYDCPGGGICNAYVELSANFQRLGPGCRLFRVADEPVVAADITITLDSLTDPPSQETLKLSTIASNLAGATSVSSPDGTMAASVLGTFSADGMEGASLPGYFITCTSDGSLLDLGGASLSDNPWDGRPSADDTGATCSFNDGSPSMPYPGPAIDAEPCALAYLTGGDPFAMFAFLNDSLGVTQGDACGQSYVDLDIYSRPPLAMSTGSTTAPSVTLASLVPRTQGGTGAYSDLVFCVPGHGLGFMDKNTPSPCDIMDRKRSFEADETTASQQADYIPGGKLAPFMPFVYTPNNPNVWPATDGEGGAYYLMVKPNKPARLDVVLTLAGGSVGIRNSVPNAVLDPTVTFCAVGAGRAGTANYKVCNSGTEPSPANYNLFVQCGLASTYSDVTLQFTAPSGALTTPATRLIANVAAGECRTPADDGPFVVQVTALETSDEDAILCAYTVQSADGDVPGQVVLARDTVQCLREDFNGTAAGVDPYSGIYVPTDYNDTNVTRAVNDAIAEAEEKAAAIEQQQEDAELHQKQVVGLVGGFVVLIFLCLGCLLISWSYNTYLGHKLDTAKNAPVVSPTADT